MLVCIYILYIYISIYLILLFLSGAKPTVYLRWIRVCLDITGEVFLSSHEACHFKVCHAGSGLAILLHDEDFSFPTSLVIIPSSYFEQGEEEEKKRTHAVQTLSPLIWMVMGLHNEQWPNKMTEYQKPRVS